MNLKRAIVHTLTTMFEWLAMTLIPKVKVQLSWFFKVADSSVINFSIASIPRGYLFIKEEI